MADKNANEKMEQLKNKIKLLEDKIAVHEDREEGFLKDKEKLVIFYDKGIINSDGEDNWWLKLIWIHE